MVVGETRVLAQLGCSDEVEELEPVGLVGIEAANFTLSIVDITGRTIKVTNLGRLDVGRHVYTIDATSFAPGIYFYTVESAGHKNTKKLIVE